MQARARRIAQEASAEGQAIALEQALELAQQEQEAQETTVVYQLKKRDPFAAVGIDLDFYVKRSRGGERATEEQLHHFKRAGLPTELVGQLSSRQAHDLREALLDRKAVGLCTPKQAKQLLAFGIDPRDIFYDEAKLLIKEQKAAARGKSELKELKMSYKIGEHDFGVRIGPVESSLAKPAIVALRVYASELVAVDWLHGGAEAFLTLGNAVLVVGLLRANTDKG